MSIKGMWFCHVNTRSIFSKLDQLKILYEEVDVLCCTETWLDNRFNNSMVNLPGKFIFRSDRKNNITDFRSRPTAGGVCIYVKNYLYNFTDIVDQGTCISDDFEIATVLTNRPNHRHFATICVYKPPKGKLAKCIEFLSSLLSSELFRKKEIIMDIRGPQY